jgi:hypothetical protein
MVPCHVNDSEFRSELLLSYRDFGMCSALINKTISFYESVTYLEKDDHDISKKCLIHLGNVVSINVSEEGENYAKIRAIFSHKYNNGYVYAFIAIDWFEKTNQTDGILECPIYKIQSTRNRSWRRIYPLMVVNQVNKVNFVHNCLSGKCIDGHDLLNLYYLKNNYFFNAI